MRNYLILAGALVCSCTAQTPINLYAGAAPGSENWTQKETSVSTPYGLVLQNVSMPTLTPYLPDKSIANGTAIIVAPGGACIGLAIEHEGTSVARWLQQKGFAALVLKYRIPAKQGEGIPPGMNFDEACKYGIADGVQAVKLVR